MLASWILFMGFVGVLLYAWQKKSLGHSAMTPKERRAHELAKADERETMAHGEVNSEIVCAQCQKRGGVRTKRVTLKKGVSGGKATAALLTGGVSLLATGLSRKEDQTLAYCANCGSSWSF